MKMLPSEPAALGKSHARETGKQAWEITDKATSSQYCLGGEKGY
jgi:hypothetical protein